MNNGNPIDPADLNQRISNKPPLLPSDILNHHVQKYFDRSDDFISVLKKYPPPRYVLERSVLKNSARKFKTAFNRVFKKTAFYFAMKSNNCPDVAKVLLEEGFGLDVSSGIELGTALSLGASDIIFSGPGKTDGELAMAVKNSNAVVVLVDSFGELGRLESICAEMGRVVSIGVRLTTQPEGLWRKFGILPERLPEFWEAVRKSDRIRLKGLQFHTSWNLTPEAQLNFIRNLGLVLSEMSETFKTQLEFIDVGGGYWPEQGEWLRHEGTPAGSIQRACGLDDHSPLIHYWMEATPIDNFAKQLGEAIPLYLSEIFPCRICFEPGRWVINDAMHLFLSVIDKKAEDLVITDAGTNAVGWERYETDYCPILNLTRPALEERTCLVLGSLCTPHDVWGATFWGRGIESGDLLMIPEQGAYTYSLRQNFIKPIPGTIII
jgi:diaminopimelate decarboxylase